MATSALLDFVGGFFHVIGTTISAKSKSVLLDLAGMPDVDSPEDDSKGEISPQQLAYGQLGVIVNPLDPGTMPDGRTPAQADYYGVRTSDGVIPLVGFDPRIDAAFPNGPQKGTIALAGYGGGFHSIDLTNNGTTNIHVIYAPYAGGDGGVAGHALAVILDTTTGNESISIVHGNGNAILLGPDGSTTIRAPLGEVNLQISDAGITLFGNTIIAGGATIGSPTGALPAAIASKIAAYITQLEGDIATALTAIGVGGAASGPNGATSFALHATTRSGLVEAIPAVNTSIF